MMKKTRKIILSIAFAAWAGAGMYAQQTVVPPSQAASSVGQSINAPVNMQNGTVSIDVPLWTVNSSKLSIPVSVSYNASGIRPGQASGLPGMGWTLNAGGVISRTVRGLPDEDANGWLNKADEIPFSDFYQNLSTIKDLADGKIDDMPDLYFFSFPGYSGKFVFDKDGIIRTLPYIPIKIKQVNASTFEIVTQDGIKYTFGNNKDAVLNDTLEIKKYTCSNADTCLYDPEKERTLTYNSEWYLTLIETPDDEDYITLSYLNITFQRDDEYFGYFSEITQIIKYKEEDEDEAPINPHTEDVVNRKMPAGYNIPFAIGSNITKKLTVIVPLCISSKTSQVCFDYICYKNMPLKGITVKDVAGQEVKTYSFVYERNQLIYIKDSKSTYPPIHFEYNGDIPYNTEKTDYWGYFNNSAEKNANTHSLSGILTAIYYPTGAYKKFTYEIHSDGTNTVGGARIKKTETGEYENDSKKIVKEYKYENMRFLAPPVDKYTITYDNAYADYIIRGVYQRSYITYPLGSTEGSHVSYGKVTVLEGALAENGKTEYFFNNTEDYYAETYDYPLNQGGGYPFPPQVSMECKRGLIDSLKIYRKNSSGSFLLVSKEKNTYTVDNINAFSFYSLKTGYKRIPVIHATDMRRRTIKIMSFAMLLDETRKYVYDPDGKNPVETRVKYYYNPANNNPRTIFKYNSLEKKATVTHLLYPSDYTGGFAGTLTSKNIINKPVEIVSYQWDCSSQSSWPLTGETKVLSGNIIKYDNYGREKEIWGLETPGTAPLEMSNFRFSNQVSGGLPEGTPGAFSPDSRYYRKKATIDLYDKGLPVQTTGKDSIPSTTIYSYNNTYPVATITNATYDEVKTALGENVSLFSNAQPTDEYLVNTMISLRDSLPNAFISSQTYNPVYGNITSGTDVNGLTSYKEYDNYNRLVTIKDHEKNIVRHIEYGNNVFRLSATATTSNSITLALQGTDEVTNYTIEYKYADYSTAFQSVTIPRASTYTITGLVEKKRYFIKVTAKKGSATLTALNPVIASTGSCILTLSENYFTSSNGPGSYTIYVTSNENWNVFVESIASVSRTSGSGNESFVVTWPANYGEERTFTIRVKSENCEDGFSITQQCGYCGGICPIGQVRNEAGRCVPIGE